MIKKIKTVLLALSFIVLTACNFTDLDSATKTRLQQTNQDELEQKGSVKLEQTLFGCSITQSFHKNQSAQEINCDATQVSNLGSEIIAVIVLLSFHIAFFVLAFGLALKTYTSITTLASRGFYEMKTSLTKTLVMAVFFCAFIIPFSSVQISSRIDMPVSLGYRLLANLFFRVIQTTETAQLDLAKTSIFRFPEQKVPAATSKSHQFTPLITHFICVGATTNKTQASFDLYPFDGGYKLVSSEKSCETSILFAIDTKGGDLAKRNGLFNYKAKQLEEAKRIAKQVLEYSKQAAMNVLNNYSSNELIKADFDPKRSCDGIYQADISSLDSIGFNTYIRRASECISEYFVHETNKYPGLTQDYLKNRNYLKDNTVEFCSHDYSGRAGTHTYTLGQAQAMSKSCLESACSFGAGDGNGSLAQCSTAINVYNALHADRLLSKPDFTLLPLYANGIRAIGSDVPGRVFADSFSSTFEKRADDYEYKSDISKLWSLTLPIERETKAMQASTFMTFLDKGWTGDASDNFSVSDSITGITNLKGYAELGQKGLLGLDKLFVCIKSPYQYSEGFNCGSAIDEFQGVGTSLIVSGLEGKTFALLNKAKIRKNSGREAGIDTAKSNILKLITNKYAISIIGILTANSTIDSVYGTSTFSSSAAIADTGLMLTLMTVPEFQTFYTFIQDSKIALGVLLCIVIPALPIIYFLKATLKIMNKIIKIILVTPIQATASLIDEDELKKDADFIEPIKNLAIIILMPSLLYFSVSSYSYMTQSIFMALPNLQELIASMTASTNNTGTATSFIAEIFYKLFGLYVVFSIYKATASLIYNSIEVGIFVLLGHQTDEIDEEHQLEQIYSEWGHRISGKN